MRNTMDWIHSLCIHQPLLAGHFLKNQNFIIITGEHWFPQPARLILNVILLKLSLIFS